MKRDRTLAGLMAASIACMGSMGTASASTTPDPLWGDFTGDGVPESAFLSATDDLLYVMASEDGQVWAAIDPYTAPGVQIELVFAGPDINSDGEAEINLLATKHGASGGVAWIQVHSATDGEYIGFVWIDGSGSAISADDFIRHGDANSDGSVDQLDIIEVAKLLASKTYSSKGDSSTDGELTSADLERTVSAAEAVQRHVDAAPLIRTLNSVVGAAQPDRPTDMGYDFGIFGCLRCFISCGRRYYDVWECARDAPSPYVYCDERHVDPTSLEYTECVEERLRDGPTECLNDMIDLTTRCGRCIMKCAPRFTVIADKNHGRPNSGWIWAWL